MTRSLRATGHSPTVPGAHKGGQFAQPWVLSRRQASNTRIGLCFAVECLPALQLAQVGEQRRDFAAGVLVDAVETYERIEDEQARLQSGDGLGEVAEV
jgi:hypothetical protein